MGEEKRNTKGCRIGGTVLLIPNPTVQQEWIGVPCRAHISASGAYKVEYSTYRTKGPAI